MDQERMGAGTGLIGDVVSIIDDKPSVAVKRGFEQPSRRVTPEIDGPVTGHIDQ